MGDFYTGTYAEGFEAGYSSGYEAASRRFTESQSSEAMSARAFGQPAKRKATKRKQTGKAAILTKMTKPIWEKYKKGRGKQNYDSVTSDFR